MGFRVSTSFEREKEKIDEKSWDDVYREENKSEKGRRQ